MKNRCEVCDAKLKYSDEYYASYCSSCVRWIEDKCSDSECVFCGVRPDRPKVEPKRRK